MANEFNGSIAQVNVQFPIETVIMPLAGENYSRVLVYVPVSQASAYLPGTVSPAAGQLVTINSSNYGAIAGGTLKGVLEPFFKKATTATVGIAIYNDAEGTEESPAANTLADVYAATKYWGYFKLGIAEAADYDALQVSLSALCLPDPLYSDMWIGTSDNNVLVQSSTLMTSLKQQKSNARVIFNPDTSINPALAQLGATLSSVNTTGTPVGNSVDMVAFGTIGASGTEDADGNRQNLGAAQKAILDQQKIGYNTYVGDGTSNVVTEGSLTLQGESVGANWVKHYVEYMCKVKTANYITQMNKFVNNDTYQGILTILTDQISAFIAMGRLAEFHLTAPVFRDLPPAAGDTIVVQNAWDAMYVDNVRQVQVFGTLYIQQPTR